MRVRLPDLEFYCGRILEVSRAPLQDLDGVISAVAAKKELKVILHPGGSEGNT